MNSDDATVWKEKERKKVISPKLGVWDMVVRWRTVVVRFAGAPTAWWKRAS